MREEPIICPSCNQKNNPAFYNCWKCRAALKPDAPALPVKLVPPVVGFWKRLLADIIDSLLLGAVGMAIIFPARNLLSAMGDFSILPGVIISFLYTGILQSSIGKGQSLAKKVLGIQVVRMDGSYLSLGQSFLRYSILAYIVYGSLIFVPLIGIFPKWAFQINQIAGISILLVGMACSLVVALHPLKRGLQDYVAGSLVVPEGKFDRERIQAANDLAKSRKAWVISALAATVLSIVLSVSPYFMPKELSGLGNVQSEISKNTPLKRIQTSLKFVSVPEKKTFLVIKGVLPKEVFDNKEERKKWQNETAKIASSSYTGREIHGISVSVSSGVSIGISNISMSDNSLYDPQGNPSPEKED